MAKQSDTTKFATEVVRGVVIIVVGGGILAGLTAAYFSNLLPLVLLGIGLFIVFAGPIIYFRWVRSKSKTATPSRTGLPLRTPGTLQSLNTLLKRNVRRPQKRLKHVVTVSLDTEVVPFDYRSEWFEEGDVIEVEAESQKGASFHFLVCDDRDLTTNKKRTVNFEYFEGKEFTTQFKKQFEIPESGMWHFIAYTPEEEEYTTVSLTISKMEN